MSSLTGKSLNPVMNRRSVIASAAGLGAMSILAGCSSNGGDSGSASGDASFKIGTIGPLTGANASYGKSVTQAVELGYSADFQKTQVVLPLQESKHVVAKRKRACGHKCHPTER